MRPQAVLFDLDGVITDTAEYHFAAWKQLAEEMGISIDRAFNETLKGVSRMESLERILQHGRSEQSLSAEAKAMLAAKKNDHFVSLLEHLTPSDISPGIMELLLELKELGVPAVIASASKNAPKILNALEIAHLFVYVVPPDSVAHGKPAPDIFLAGAAKVGADPAACIALEDAQAGIEAIKAAGMIAIGIGEEALLKASGADIVIPNTARLSFPFIENALNHN